MPNTHKVAVVDALSTKLTQNPNIALLGFEKTTHISMETLRRSLKKVDASMSVIKASLLEKAVEKSPEMKEFHTKALPLKHATALVDMRGDWSASLKAIFDFAKKDTTVIFKSGFLDRVYYDRPALERLAQLPSKTVLLGRVIGSLKSPIQRLDHSIKFPMSYFVNTLKARAAQV